MKKDQTSKQAPKQHVSNKTEKGFYVVGIGASAGGLDAIQQLFDHIPEDTGMAFIIIQHLSPDFKSLMPELLYKHTKMQIFTAEDKQTIKPNCVYLNQRNKNLHIKGRKLYLLDKGPKHNLNLPIDIFFHTLGEEYKEKSIGVILSGTGSDGSRGIKTIKEAGGTIIVQDPASAQFDGMPNSSISTNLVDFILPPDKIADVLFRFPNTRKLILTEDDQDKQSNDVIFYNILEEIHKYSGVDFRQYKRNTLIRRLEKRMGINNIDRLYDYLIFLKSNPDEKETLKQDFLIGVTSFFRDIEAFGSVRNNVIPEICKNKKDSEPIRVWTPACSTGEETYSIAILLDEYIRSKKYSFDFKIFATDVDSAALNIAGAGSYSINIGNEIDKKYLEDYFFKTGDKIQIIKRIREKIVFSNHDILKDPPFIRMDFIVCRNMLIYFENKAQAHVMQNFQFSLNKFGYLFLGNSESLGQASKLFRTIDTKWKIFQNISDIKQTSPQNNPENRINSYSFKSTNQNIKHPVYQFKENPETVFHKYLSKKHSPASIFIDSDYNILFIKGDAGKRLSHTEGLFQNNLLKMVNPEIASAIRSGIRGVESKNKDITITGIVNKTNGQNYSFDLSFHKPDDSNLNGIYLLQFSEEKPLKGEDSVVIQNLSVDKINDYRFEELENELNATKAELQHVVEELETSNEELQSSNEELMASNEELQSTNEELQSVNEELYTVNSELQEKNKELTNVNNDIINLLDSTDIGTLFLDNSLKIRKYTPALQKHFNLRETDIGRPISSFTSNFDEKIRRNFIKDCKESLLKLKVIEKEVVDLDGNPFLKKISPFVTLDKKIDGVVISFVDIKELKKIEKERDISELQYRKLFENLNEGFAHSKIITNKNGEPVDWEYIAVNQAFEKQTGFKTEDVIGKRITDILPGVKDDPANWIKLYGETALTGKEQFIENYSAPLGRYYYVHVFSPRKGEFAATFADITELKKKEEQLRKSENHLKEIQEISHVGSWVLDVETNEVTWTEELYKIYGFDPSLPPPPYPEHGKLFTKDSWELLTQSLTKTVEQGIPYELELETIRENNSNGWMWVRGEAKKDNTGKTIALHGAAQDITARKQMELKLREEQEFSQKITDLSPAGIYIYNLEKGTNEFMNSQYTEILGYTMEEINNMDASEFFNLFHVDDAENIQKHMQNVANGKSQNKIEYRFKHKNGNWVWCYSVDSPFKINNNGKVVSFIGVFVDITEMKETEEQLKIAKKQADSANIHKNYFLANMSHEIRTPMNGVVGFSNLLRDETLTKEVKEKYIDIIESNSNQLLNLIDDIIDVAKIESNELKITSANCDVLKMLNGISENFIEINPKLKQKEVELKLEIPEEYKSLSILTDCSRLEQVITNLLNNALKFSEKGIVCFGFTVKQPNLEFFVTDQGIGIPKEKLNEIFERFRQLNYENSVHYGGTGLGLAICKGIVQLLGGEIFVESESGKGSTFKFTIPLKQVRDINTENPAPNKGDFYKLLDNKRILIADDEELIRAYFMEILKPYNVDLTFAKNGKEAVDKYIDSKGFDIVLMDLRMPEMDGFKAAEYILKSNPEAKIIAQTAYAMHQEKEKCIESGFVDYLTKPINKDLLLNKIKIWI